MQRPTPVTIFGILNIVFAIIGIMGAICSLAFFTIIDGNSDNPIIQIMQKNPVFQAMRDNPSYLAYLKFSMILGVVVAVLLLVAGIGLLKLKPWARMLSIIYGVYGIISVIGNAIASYFFLIQPMFQKAGVDQAAGAAGGAMGGIYGGFFGLVYPVLLIFFMMRPVVVAAFNPSSTNSTKPPPLPRS